MKHHSPDTTARNWLAFYFAFFLGSLAYMFVALVK